MFGKLLGKIVAAPIRIANIAAKVVVAPAKMMTGDNPWEDNVVDDIAEGVEESAKKILDD